MNYLLFLSFPDSSSKDSHHYTINECGELEIVSKGYCSNTIGAKVEISGSQYQALLSFSRDSFNFKKEGEKFIVHNLFSLHLLIEKELALLHNYRQEQKKQKLEQTRSLEYELLCDGNIIPNH